MSLKVWNHASTQREAASEARAEIKAAPYVPTKAKLVEAATYARGEAERHEAQAASYDRAAAAARDSHDASVYAKGANTDRERAANARSDAERHLSNAKEME